jgi:hypothetical protein
LCNKLSCKLQVSISEKIEAFIYKRIQKDEPEDEPEFKQYAAFILKHINSSQDPKNDVLQKLEELKSVKEFTILCYKADTVLYFREKGIEPRFILYKNYRNPYVFSVDGNDSYTMYSLVMDTDFENDQGPSSELKIPESKLRLDPFNENIKYKDILNDGRGSFTLIEKHSKKIVEICHLPNISDKYDVDYLQYTYSCKNVFDMTQCIENKDIKQKDGKRGYGDLVKLPFGFNDIATNYGTATIMYEIKINNEIINFINKEDKVPHGKEDSREIFEQNHPDVKTVSILKFEKPNFPEQKKPKYVILYKSSGWIYKKKPDHVYSLVFNTDLGFEDNCNRKIIQDIMVDGVLGTNTRDVPTLISLIKGEYQLYKQYLGGKRRTKKKRMKQVRFSKGKKLIPRPRSRRIRTSRK